MKALCATAMALLTLPLVLAACGGGTTKVEGTRAGNLDAGSVITTAFALGRGQSYMIGQNSLKNVGKDPILVESIQPKSSSPDLRATRARIWLSPRHSHLGLPTAWPGWPPKNPPTKPPKWAPSWVQPNPAYLSLPTHRIIPPGREAQVVYGILLRSEASARTSITALRITFKQGSATYVWTLPSHVRLQRP